MNAFECVTDAAFEYFEWISHSIGKLAELENIPCTGLKTINFQQEKETATTTTTVVEATVEVFVVAVAVVLCWFVYLFKFRISTTLK